MQPDEPRRAGLGRFRTEYVSRDPPGINRGTRVDAGRPMMPTAVLLLEAGRGGGAQAGVLHLYLYVAAQHTYAACVLTGATTHGTDRRDARGRG